MRVAIYTREIKESYLFTLKRLFYFLEHNAIDTIIYEHLKQHSAEFKTLNLNKYETFNETTDLKGIVDLFLTIGGDGTFLDSVAFIRDSNVPVAGLNCGTLGFLTDITSDNLENALSQILKNQHRIETLSLLELKSPNSLFNDHNFALNELTVHKLDNSSMITIKTCIDNELIATYRADGLIIATPTGSTAYSLSVGGPIVAPGLGGFLITPIASHHLTVRPIIVPDNVEIQLEVEGRGAQFMTSIDHRSVAVDFSTTLVIRKANFGIRIVRLPDLTFYSTLRNKLMWGADKRN